MPTKLIDYDSAEHFRDDEAQAELLRDATKSGDPRYIDHARTIVGRARATAEKP
jgi:DNA-binding phage protein